MESKRQVYEQSFKDKAVLDVESGSTAAQVARELGLPAWLIQNWVRSARGYNKERRQRGRFTGEKRYWKDGKVYLLAFKFQAYDSHRKPHAIHVYRESKCDCSSSTDTLLLTEKREQVSRIRKGLYKLEIGRILESDDPRAP